MKIVIYDRDDFILYLNKYNLDNIDFKNKLEVEVYFKELSNNLNKNYKLNINGYYNVYVYINDYYGLIVEFVKLENDYIRLTNDRVDMRIKFNTDSIFLYETSDYFLINLFENDDLEIYFYNNKFYIQLNKNLDETKMMYLLENTNIIYDESVDDIINSQKVKTCI